MGISDIVLIFSIFILVLLTVKGCKLTFGNITSDVYFSKNQTDWLRGIAIMVVYSHYYVYLGISYDSGIASQTLNSGFLGVAIFLFLSGYATMISKLRKTDYLDKYIYRRTLRLYVPFLVSFVIFLVILLCVGEKLELSDFVGIPIMSLPDTTNWYLKVQFVLYIVFFLGALIIKNTKYLSLAILVTCLIYMIVGYKLGLYNYWYECSFLFPLGMIFALYKEKVYNILHKKLVVIIAFLFMIVCVLYYFYGGVFFEIGEILAFVMIVACLCRYTSGNSKVLAYLGSISLELYLSHIVLLNALRSKLIYEENILTYLIFMVASILLAIIVNKTSNLLVKYTNRLFKVR